MKTVEKNKIKAILCHTVSSYAELTRQDWVKLLECDFTYASKCKDWDIFYVSDWVKLLSKHSSLEKYCDSFFIFSADDWVELIIANPNFAKRCDKFNEFAIKHWENILDIGNKSIKDAVQKYKRAQLTLLAKHPDRADACDKWNDFTDNEILSLIEKEPKIYRKAYRCYYFDYIKYLEENPRSLPKTEIKRYKDFLIKERGFKTVITKDIVSLDEFSLPNGIKGWIVFRKDDDGNIRLYLYAYRGIFSYCINTSDPKATPKGLMYGSGGILCENNKMQRQESYMPTTRQNLIRTLFERNVAKLLGLKKRVSIR